MRRWKKSLVKLTNQALKPQRRRRLQKRHLQSEVALLQTLSRLFHLVQFVKCWQFFLELNSKGQYRSSGKKKESHCLVFTSSTIREIRHFHVVVVQRRQRNVQKSVMHVQSCYFANIRVRFFGTIWIRISDPLGSCRSNEPTNPPPKWIQQFIWSSMIRVISDHWSWSGSSQSKAP